MKRKLLLGTAFLVMAFAVFAQGMPPIEEVEAFLNETDAILADAAPRFEGDVPEMATEHYEHAVEMQEEAWEMLERNSRMAFEKSRQSRELLQQALRMLDVTPPGECEHPGLLDLIEYNYEMIDELTAPVEESGSEELSDLLARAIDMNDDAQAAYEGENFPQANRLAQSARHTLEQIRRMLAGHGGGGGGGIDAERIREELDRTDGVIGEVTEAMGEDAPEWAVELLERATEAQANAWEHFEDGDYREAMTLTRRARDLALRARRPEGRGEIADRVERELLATDNTIERVTPIVEESGNEDAIDLLADAVELQAEARTAFEAENYEDALHKTNTARRMALRAAGMIEDFDPTEIREAIAHTQELIDEATPTIEESGNLAAIGMLERAVALQEEAREDFLAEEYRSALAKTTTARNLVRRALAMLSDEE